jgi:hypothetical protein
LQFCKIFKEVDVLRVLKGIVQLAFVLCILILAAYVYLGWYSWDEVRMDTPAGQFIVGPVCDITGGTLFEDYSCSYSEKVSR